MHYIVSASLCRTLRVHRHVCTHSVPCCKFIYKSFRARTDVDEYSESRSVILDHEVPRPTLARAGRKFYIRLPAIPKTSRSAIRPRKKLALYICVWLYYATFSGPERDITARAADYKILLYTTPKSTIKLISPYGLYNEYIPSLKAGECFIRGRARVWICVYVYVCVYVCVYKCM